MTYVLVNGRRMPHDETTYKYIVRESARDEVHLQYEDTGEVRYCRSGIFYSKGE
jgi:hypothetical protein